MSSSREKMLQAQQAIKEQRWDDARAILRGINHPMALDWLDKIDQKDPPKKKADHTARSVLIIVVLLIVGTLSLMYFVQTMQAGSKSARQAIDDLDAKAAYCQAFCRATQGGTACIDTCWKAPYTPSSR